MEYTVAVARPGFSRQETFAKKADAAAWKQMVETTLDHREHVKFDLEPFAAGLARTVRAHGAKVTRAAFLKLEVSPEAWAQGYPVKVDIEAMFMDVLAGRKLKPAKAYREAT